MFIRILLMAACLATGCRTYRAQPLDPNAILSEVVARRSAPTGEALTLRTASDLLAEHNPAVRDARAHERATKTAAAVSTPLSNPSIAVAPTYLSSASPSTGVEVGLGWAFPLGGTRKITDEMRALESEAVGVEAVGLIRNEYLALRGEVLALQTAQEAAQAESARRQEAERTLGVVKRFAQAGSATALDVNAAQIELAQRSAAAMVAEAAVGAARGAIAARLGIEARPWRVDDRPQRPQAVPALAALRALALRHSPDLAARRAQYRVAEKRLRLEIAKQWPGLQLGPFLEREEGNNKWGLEIGIDIPLFDRNQVGIAQAKSERTRQREAFGNAIARISQSIEAARRQLLARRAHLAYLTEEVAPLSEQTIGLATRSVEAGRVTAVALLDALQRRGEVQLDLVTARAAVDAAWSALERACGAPLLLFPNAPSLDSSEEDRS